MIFWLLYSPTISREAEYTSATSFHRAWTVIFLLWGWLLSPVLVRFELGGPLSGPGFRSGAPAPLPQMGNRFLGHELRLPQLAFDGMTGPRADVAPTVTLVVEIVLEIPVNPPFAQDAAHPITPSVSSSSKRREGLEHFFCSQPSQPSQRLWN